MKKISVIDSHTGGEPTRVVIAGGPDLGSGSVTDRLKNFREQHDRFRSAVVNEPRGSDVLVGALLVEPADKSCVCGVIFFNNVGCLAMCGHGTIGLVITLAHLGKIQPGDYKIETPVGIVTATLHANGEVSVANVPSHRQAKSVTVDVPGVGKISGDVAWGGNWFFLVGEHGRELSLANVESLTDLTWRIRQAVNAQGFPEVDHVELFGPPQAGGDSRNFVLCPGKAYDRSPCGTGTSAKLACLAADGKLAENKTWIQESILGSKFTGKFRWLNRERGEVLPNISGTAHVNAESTLLLADDDPFCWGMAITPMGPSLRFGGTMEIAGLNEDINPVRVQGIIKAVPKYFPKFTPEDFAGVQPWRGLRPCSPDGLPYLGRTVKFSNLIIATGHAMMGMSLSPVTGQLVSEIVSGEKPAFDLSLLSPDRFA